MVSARDYHEEQQNQSYRTIRLPSLRGRILAWQNNHLAELAANTPAYTLSLYLEDPALRTEFREAYFKAKGKRPLKRAEQAALEEKVRYQVVSNGLVQLSRLLEQPLSLSESFFRKHYNQSLALPLPVLNHLSVTQIARFEVCTTNAPGLDLDIRPTRVYPQGPLAAHLLGYLVRDNDSYEEEEAFFNYRLPDYAGYSGLELACNDTLRGRAGGKSVLVNSLGYRQSERVWSPVVAGQDVLLTLDLGLQRVVEQALHDVGGEDTRGAVVVMDVRNGDLLAMCSSPAYDPNAFLRGWTPREQQRWTNETLGVQHNRAIYGGYAPGSIFKIITGLAALEAGWSPTNLVQCPGYALVGSRRIHCVAPGEHNFTSALKKSCNKYFIDCGIGVAGPERILALAQRFHLGERTGLPLRNDSPGLLPTRSWQVLNQPAWRDGDTANLSIGQGYLLVTPLQEALMISAVANGGKLFWPRLVLEARAPELHDGSLTRPLVPGRLRDTLPVSAQNLRLVQEAMRADVEEPGGTGHEARVPGYPLCGKTGTAEVKKGSVVVDRITWFASYGPFDEPRYAVVVMVVSGGSGGRTCAPVARKIYAALQQRDRLGRESNTPNMAGLH